MPLTFLLGGTRSGKSSLAVRLASEWEGPVIFIATAEARDDGELTARIARHRLERPAGWRTVEEPLDLIGELGRIPERAFLVVDCLTFWTANALEAGWSDEEVERAAADAAALAAARRSPTVVVSNEVGMGVVPPTPIGRSYRDLLGRVNAVFAEHAERAYLVVAGRRLERHVSLETLLARIRPADAEAEAAAQTALDAKTKPRGSLGELEALACRLAAIRGAAVPGRLRAALVLAAGDHGYARGGVSAYPQEVTGQMLAAFAAGGAAIDVLARETGLHLVVVDAGVVEPVVHPAIRALRLGSGTADAAAGPAMSRESAVAGLLAGAALAEELSAEGYGIVGTGDMGIGNTTAAAALCAALLPAEPEAVCGRGTGVDDAGLARKVEAVRSALAVNRPDAADPVGVLAAVGGFELAVLAGVCLGGAATGSVVLLDGFVTGAAALVAARLAPAAAGRMVASHRSPEPGHALVLADLRLRPLLDLGLRLGEGSGAALALPLLSAALAILADMATFETAGVTDAGA